MSLSDGNWRFLAISAGFSSLAREKIAMFTVNIKYGFSAVNTIGLTPEGPVFGPPGYEINLLYIAGLVALILGGAGPCRSMRCEVGAGICE
jgi:hypothetical protein